METTRLQIPPTPCAGPTNSTLSRICTNNCPTHFVCLPTWLFPNNGTIINQIIFFPAGLNMLVSPVLLSHMIFHLKVWGCLCLGIHSLGGGMLRTLVWEQQLLLKKIGQLQLQFQFRGGTMSFCYFIGFLCFCFLIIWIFFPLPWRNRWGQGATNLETKGMIFFFWLFIHSGKGRRLYSVSGF